LQAKTSEIRNRWVKFLKLILSEAENSVKKRDVTNEEEVKERRKKIKNELEDIWENEIMTNFSAHWDYKKHCPKSGVERTSAALNT